MKSPAKSAGRDMASGQPHSISENMANMNTAMHPTIIRQHLMTKSRICGERALSRSNLYQKQKLKNIRIVPGTALANPAKPADFATALPLAAAAPIAAAFAEVDISGKAANT